MEITSLFCTWLKFSLTQDTVVCRKKNPIGFLAYILALHLFG
jgi:hypothetical protein